MTAAPRFTADTQQIERYFAALPPSADACYEIGIGKVRRDNPSKIDVYPPKPAWNEGQRFRWLSADTRARHIHELARLIEKCHNVYISRARYTSPKRDPATALPSRTLVFDDVTPDPIYSMLVETSPNNYQGYIFTNEDMDPVTVRELSERGAKALAGTKDGHADTCYDVTRLVRIPGSYNTKHGATFQVRITAITGTTYSITELRARWPEVESKELAVADLAWPKVEQCLGDIDGITKRIKTTSPTRHMLQEAWDDRSKQRYALACNLRNKLGYPDEEIAAILVHFNWGHLEQKGTTWLKADIERCLAEAHRLYPNVATKPSYCRLDYQHAKPAQPLPQVERPKRGRQTRLTDNQYLDWLHHEDNRIHSQSEAAQALGVGVATIRRIEKRLQDAGKIERCTVRKRGGTYSYATIFSAITNTSQLDIKDSQSASLVLSQHAAEAQPHAEKHEPQTVVESTHPPDRATPEVQPSPSEAVAWAFTVLRAEDEDEDKARRVTWKRVKDWITENVPGTAWTERQIKSAYNVHRKQEQREYSAGYWEGLRVMRVDELQRAIESVDHRLHNPAKRPRLTPAQLRVRREHLRMVLDQKIADAKRATTSGAVCFTKHPPNVLPPALGHLPAVMAARYWSDWCTRFGRGQREQERIATECARLKVFIGDVWPLLAAQGVKA